MPTLYNPGKKKGIFFIPSGATVSPITPVPAFSNTKSTLFDGIDDYVDCGNITTLNGATEATWSCWFKLDITDYTYFYGQWGSGDDRLMYVLLMPTYLGGRIDVGLSPNAAFRSTTSTMVVDTWYNLIVTFNGGNTSTERCKVYLDGVEQANTGFGGPASLYTSTTNFHIGKRTDILYGEINGNVDEFAIFDIELNQTEVNEIYDNGPSNLATHSKSDDLKHWWRMGDKVVSFPTIPDQVGSNNGTAYNGNEVTMIVEDVP